MLIFACHDKGKEKPQVIKNLSVPKPAEPVTITTPVGPVTVTTPVTAVTAGQTMLASVKQRDQDGEQRLRPVTAEQNVDAKKRLAYLLKQENLKRQRRQTQ